jgi:hypothetical protein
MEKARYPDDWEAIALTVKRAANWTCQECGKPCMKPGEDGMDFEERLLNSSDWEYWHSQICDETMDEEHGLVWISKPGRFVLTVAHLDQNPANNDPGNLKALCSVCHLRHDAPFRKANSLAKRERQGQLRLFDLVPPQPAGHGADPTRIQIPIRWEVGGV